MELILPLAPAKVDEITLSPSLGSKNQVLITVNQSLQIMEESVRGSHGVPVSALRLRALGVLSGLLLRLKFQSNIRLLSSSNRKILLSECKRGERGDADGVIMTRSSMHAA